MTVAAFIISIISILINIIMAIRTLLSERKNVDIEVINQAYLDNIKRVHFNIIFTNKSKNPISITGISISSMINSKEVIRYGRHLKHRVAHTTIKGEINQEIINTTIPFSIDSYGAIYALITIDLIEYKTNEFLNENSYLTINTSRGQLNDRIYTKDIKVIDTNDMLDFPK